MATANAQAGTHTDSQKSKLSLKCKKILQKYPVEPYEKQKDKKGGRYRGKQSHHVIQNSHFQKPRGTNVAGLCKGYSEGGAPCIPLNDGTNVKTEHGRVSKMQKADAKRYRASGKNPTYKQARADAKKQLMAKPKPGLSKSEAECILVEVDKYFKKAFGSKNISSKQVRTPGQKGSWKPNVKAAGKAAGKRV